MDRSIFHRYLTKKSRLFLIYFVLHVFYLLLMRIGFLSYFIDRVPKGGMADIFEAFYIGSKFDLRLAAILTLPLVITLIVPHFRVEQTKHIKKALRFISCLLILAVVIIQGIDFGFFAYLGTRISASSVEVIQNPIISLQMAWETYPMVWIILALILFTFIHYQLLGRLLREEILYGHGLTLKRKVGSFLLCFLVFVGALYGKLAYYPLRWSEAYFSTDTFTSNFALNPVLNIIDTLKFTEKNYDRVATESYYDEVSRYLQVDIPNKETLNFKRMIKKEGQNSVSKPNIVIIVLESLAANKTSLFQNKLDPTPYLRKLAEESVVFKKYFTPTEATARGLFATMTGIPDVSAAKTSSRNPLVVNQHTIMNEFDGYEKYYFLGGSANWGNIRGIFSYNVDGIQIFEEGSYTAPRNDVWGISDLDLFIEANKTLSSKARRPFIALIQSSGFHRPYTIPDNQHSYRTQSFTQKELEEYSFSSNDEYNSIRFQDYSFGHFMSLAKNESYYRNTIFVVAGDHGLPAPKSVNMPQSLVDLRLTIHNTPLVIHAPNLLKPKVYNKIASQLDMLPTLASLAGIDYVNTTLGRDLFNEEYDKERYAFTYSWHERPKRIGLISDEFYYLDSPSQKGLFRYLDNSDAIDVSAQHPDVYERMKKICEGIYQTAKYMLFNNPKLESEKISAR